MVLHGIQRLPDLSRTYRAGATYALRQRLVVIPQALGHNIEDPT